MPSDVVTDFFSYTQDAWSPEIFRRWAGIALVAGALERRVYVRTGEFTTFPNLYTLLVASPGTGKQVISKVRELLLETFEPDTKNKAFKVADSSVTKASLVDTLADAKATRISASGDSYNYAALFVGAEEFSVLLPSYDQEIVGVLNSIYNNETQHSERRRWGRPPRIVIDYPMLNILGGIQPALMSANFPEEVWTTGLGRRCIMVFSADKTIRNPFAKGTETDSIRTRLLRRLGELSQMQGAIGWSKEAEEYFEQWWMEGGLPAPEHSKLESYKSNRAMNIMKLSGISVASRGEGMKIELVDLQRAMGWLLDAERVMPDIFRAMVGKSDQAIIEELHRWALAKYIMEKNQPLNSQLVWKFVAERAPSDKVKFIIDAAEQQGALNRLAGTNKFTPKGVWDKRNE